MYAEMSSRGTVIVLRVCFLPSKKTVNTDGNSRNVIDEERSVLAAIVGHPRLNFPARCQFNTIAPHGTLVYEMVTVSQRYDTLRNGLTLFISPL